MEKRYVVHSEHGFFQGLTKEEAIRQVMLFADHGVNSHILAEDDGPQIEGLQ